MLNLQHSQFSSQRETVESSNTVSFDCVFSELENGHSFFWSLQSKDELGKTYKRSTGNY